MRPFKNRAAIVGLMLGCLAVSTGCVQGVVREVQFGALDGLNGFVADGVAAILVAVLPFFSPVQ